MPAIKSVGGDRIFIRHPKNNKAKANQSLWLKPPTPSCDRRHLLTFVLSKQLSHFEIQMSRYVLMYSSFSPPFFLFLSSSVLSTVSALNQANWQMDHMASSVAAVPVQAVMSQVWASTTATVVAVVTGMLILHTVVAVA